MRRWIARRLPKVPDWRWQIMNAIRNGEELEEPLHSFLVFVDDNVEDTEEALGLGKVDLNSDAVLDAISLICNQPPVGRIVRDMLSEHVDKESLSKIIKQKFKIDISIEVLDIYEFLFWDTINLSAYDFAKFIVKRKGKIPKPPPTNGIHRADYIKFVNGGEVELDKKKTLQHMFTRVFFRAEELFKEKKDAMALRAVKTAMDLEKRLSGLGGEKKGATIFDIDIVFPDDDCIDIEDLEGEVDIPNV